MKVVEEGVRLICSEVCVNATNSEIHLRHFPCVRIGLLPIDRNRSTPTAVGLDEFGTLYEHAATAATGVQKVHKIDTITR